LLQVLCLLFWLALPAASQSAQPTDLENPKDIRYDGGNVEITASKKPITWAGYPNVETNVYSLEYKEISYDASYAPATIRVQPDTTLNIKLYADIDYDGADDCDHQDHQYTNLHYHGFEVSPTKPQDDVFIKVKNKESFQYAVTLPPGHPEGMFWYHPHPHGCSFFQVNGGMSGALIVGDILKHQYPDLDGIKERILLLKDGDPRPGGAQQFERRVLKFAAAPSAHEKDPNLITVNGVAKPTIAIQRNEKQFFRIGNVGADMFIKIAIEPLVRAEIIAVDGMATDRGIWLKPEGWLLPPGSRVEMVVEGPAPGDYKIVSKEIPGALSPRGGTLLATLKAGAGPAPQGSTPAMQTLEHGPKARSAYYPTNEEFAGSGTADECTIHKKPPDTPRTRGCTFVFTQKNGEFLINDKVYDENFTDVTCKIGKVYEWTLCNDTTEHHAFHIHQIHFDVLDIDGKQIEAPVRDVVDLPRRDPKDRNRLGRTRIKMSFQHAYLEGRFVFHCHMLTHEDKGMMMNIVLEK
jgi:FtsP/CotA-like multicopper oxidase with cupredoxin domain